MAFLISRPAQFLIQYWYSIKEPFQLRNSDSGVLEFLSFETLDFQSSLKLSASMAQVQDFGTVFRDLLLATKEVYEAPFETTTIPL